MRGKSYTIIDGNAKKAWAKKSLEWQKNAAFWITIIREQLDLTGFQIGIFHSFRPPADTAMDGQHEFAPDPAGFLMTLGIDIRIEYNLNESLPVAKIDKYNASMVPPPVGPAHQHHFFPNMRYIHIPAVMGSFSVCQKVGQNDYLANSMMVSSKQSSPISSWVLVCMVRRTALFPEISRSPRISV